MGAQQRKQLLVRVAPAATRVALAPVRGTTNHPAVGAVREPPLSFLAGGRTAKVVEAISVMIRCGKGDAWISLRC